VGRPARRLYRLTAEGATEARQALAELRAQLGGPAAAPDPRPAW
jgi:PadR family transcriptional regulator, regulatory protein PadR